MRLQGRSNNLTLEVGSQVSEKPIRRAAGVHDTHGCVFANRQEAAAAFEALRDLTTVPSSHNTPTPALKTSTTAGGEHSAPGRASNCTPGAPLAQGLPFGEAAAGETAPWKALIAASADYVPAGAPPALVTRVAAATIARPFNSDIACEVSLAGMAMILEHHGVSSHSQGLVGDLVGFLSAMAHQRQMGV